MVLHGQVEWSAGDVALWRLGKNWRASSSFVLSGKVKLRILVYALKCVVLSRHKIVGVWGN